MCKTRPKSDVLAVIGVSIIKTAGQLIKIYSQTLTLNYHWNYRRIKCVVKKVAIKT